MDPSVVNCTKRTHRLRALGLVNDGICLRIYAFTLNKLTAGIWAHNPHDWIDWGFWVPVRSGVSFIRIFPENPDQIVWYSRRLRA